MWLERFFHLIDESPIGAAVEKRRRLLEISETPGRIYVENVRSFFGISFRMAGALCDLAVRQGLFEKCAGLLCPHDQRILFESCGPDDAWPDSLRCSVCEALGIEPHEFSSRECKTLPFYRVAHDPAVSLSGESDAA